MHIHGKSNISWHSLRYDLIDEVDFWSQGLEDATDELDSRPALVAGAGGAMADGTVQELKMVQEDE